MKKQYEIAYIEVGGAHGYLFVTASSRDSAIEEAHDSFDRDGIKVRQMACITD